MLNHGTDATFETDVLKSSKPVLVDFWATWCGPCKMLAPVVEEISNDMENDINVVKIDVDENPNTASEFGIVSIPTLILFKDGKPLTKLVGFRPQSQIETVLKEALSK